MSLNGEKPSPHNTQAILYYTFVDPNYYPTLGIPLLFGHGFHVQSGQPASSAILSQSAANQLWPNQNPIGRSLRLGTDNQFHRKSDLVPDGPTYQVICVARDIRGIELDGSDSRETYVPLPEGRMQDYPILIRTQSDPSQLMDAIGPVVRRRLVLVSRYRPVRDFTCHPGAP